MLKKTYKIKEKNIRTAGYTLTELTVTIAILGILAAAAVPGLGDLTSLAEDSVNKANAKLLSNIAQMIKAQTGDYPEWPATFSSLTPKAASYLINVAMTYQGNGRFIYNVSAGTIIVKSGGNATMFN